MVEIANRMSRRQPTNFRRTVRTADGGRKTADRRQTRRLSLTEKIEIAIRESGKSGEALREIIEQAEAVLQRMKWRISDDFAGLERAEIKAKEKLQTAYEDKECTSVIWHDANMPEVRYFGEIELDFYGEPVLIILQDFGDDCRETPLSIRKQNDWTADFCAELKERANYAADIARTEDMLSDRGYFIRNLRF